MRQILQVIGLFVVFNVGDYVVFTFLPTSFIKALKVSKTEAFVSITLAYLVTAAVSSLAAVLTLRESAGSRLG